MTKIWEKMAVFEETSKSSCTIFTQTSSPRNKNFVETEYNTMPYKTVCEDADVSCYLIDSTSLKADADVPSTEDDPMSRDILVYTIVGPRSVEYGKIGDESLCAKRFVYSAACFLRARQRFFSNTSRFFYKLSFTNNYHSQHRQIWVNNTAANRFTFSFSVASGSVARMAFR